MKELCWKIKIKLIIKYEDWVLKPTQNIPMKIAFMLPRKIQLWCFVVVAGINGDCPDWYKEGYDNFKMKFNIKGM